MYQKGWATGILLTAFFGIMLGLAVDSFGQCSPPAWGTRYVTPVRSRANPDDNNEPWWYWEEYITGERRYFCRNCEPDGGCGWNWYVEQPPWECLDQGPSPGPNYLDYGCDRRTQMCYCKSATSWAYYWDPVCDQKLNCSFADWDIPRCVYLECVGWKPSGDGDGSGELEPNDGEITFKPTENNELAEEGAAYLPEFGDVLDYKITVTHPMTVDIIISATTFEGMAMNAIVPSGYEQYSDVSVHASSVANGWQMVESHMSSNYRNSTWRKEVYSADIIRLEVLDYAASAIFQAEEAGGNNSAREHYNLPYQPTQFQSAADDDRDGFTLWEEYRGFVFDNVGHERLSFLTNNKDVLVWKHHLSGSLSDAMYTDAAVAAGLTAFRIRTGEVANNRFVDFKSHWWNNPTLEANPLCNPGFNGPIVDDQHQGFVNVWCTDGVLYNGNPAPPGEKGSTYLTPPAPGIPGGTGVIAVHVFQPRLEEDVLSFQMHRNLIDVPSGSIDNVLAMYTQRVLTHELGHAWGLPHPIEPADGGPYTCVMSYVLSSNPSAPMENRRPYSMEDAQNGDWGWNTWITLVGPEDSYNGGCTGTIRFRP